MRRARTALPILAVGVAAIWLLAPTRSSPAGSFRLLGAAPLPPETEQALATALTAKGPDYKPHTRHLNPDGSPKYTNRLILEESPYLLQHAHNPVNWYPWGDEAFERARSEGRPVLLSVGYSTCHWCHVMEEESFEDPEIADFLNRHYVAIKVDREKRPDIDSVYMSVVQALTGGGGWPMTVWLTPDRKPFYGGTYFPARDGERGARIGFLTLLKRLDEIYEKEPDRVATSTQQITSSIQRSSSGAAAGFSDEKLAAIAGEAANHFALNFDGEYGGFGRTPKFPQSVVLEFLLREGHRTGNRKLDEMVETTLDRMAKGGIYDHVGGGFHRYSTDRQWLVPHFEKMLYDNALLVVAYLEGYQVTGREDFARVAREILRYVGREMTSPEGAFYSATDADSEGVEGKFYLWTPGEIAAVITPQRARWFDAYHGITESGNLEGKSILHVAEPLEAVAKRFGMEPAALASALDEAREDLYRARLKRIPPFKDTKILTAWNGLMISAYARAALVLGDQDYAARASKAAGFILSKMRGGGRLQHSYFQGHAEGAGFLDDYAFLEQGLLDLYEVTYEPRWLGEAIALQTTIDRHFRDTQHGGYFLTPDDGEALLTRDKPSYDGAEPSGNSVALLNLSRLAELTADARYRERADEVLQAFGPSLAQAPTALAKMLTALDFRLDAAKEIILVKPDERASEEAMLARLRQIFLPSRVLAVAAEGPDLAAQKKLVPLFEGRKTIGGKVTAFVCEAQVCKLPTTDPEVFAQQIAARTSSR
jgi:uncharacterized protein